MLFIFYLKKERLIEASKGEATDTEISDWRTRLAELVEPVESKDIFSGQDFGLYWRATDDYSILDSLDGLCASGNKSQDRLTIFSCCSMLGEKLDLLVVGDKKDLILNQRSSGSIRYYSNENSWMTSEILMDYLNRINEIMNKNNRFITIFIHDHSSDCMSFSLSNIRVVLLPELDSREIQVQPIKAGIQQCLKAHYRFNLVANVNLNKTNKRSKLITKIQD